jgi:hypothetical protein
MTSYEESDSAFMCAKLAMHILYTATVALREECLFDRSLSWYGWYSLTISDAILEIASTAEASSILRSGRFFEAS